MTPPERPGQEHVEQNQGADWMQPQYKFRFFLPLMHVQALLLTMHAQTFLHSMQAQSLQIPMQVQTLLLNRAGGPAVLAAFLTCPCQAYTPERIRGRHRCVGHSVPGASGRVKFPRLTGDGAANPVGKARSETQPVEGGMGKCGA